MPSCDHTGVPLHFHSSTTSGTACLISLRILLKVCPRQSPSSEILSEISSGADWPWLAPEFFMIVSPTAACLWDLNATDPPDANRANIAECIIQRTTR